MTTAAMYLYYILCRQVLRTVDGYANNESLMFSKLIFMISGAPEVEFVLAPLAAPVVLLLLQTRIVITRNGNYQLSLWHRHYNPL
jgi:hypothetical protein